jgi:hypothetical protein
MKDSFRKQSVFRPTVKHKQAAEEMTDELKNDLEIAFNVFKNEHHKISKLKLRTLLFSFAMYKSSARDINEYIAENTDKKDEFTFEDLYKLVYQKLYIIL